MPHQFDATLKEILSPRPDDFASVFNLPRNAPAQPLNVDLSTISAATDVAFGFGAPFEEVVDLNFQSGEIVALPEGDISAQRALERFAKLDRSTGLLGRGIVRFDLRLPDKMIVRLPRAPGESIAG